jgi:hypothetical protein
MHSRLVEIDYGRVRRLHARAREHAAMARWQEQPEIALRNAEWVVEEERRRASILGAMLLAGFCLVAAVLLHVAAA